MNVDVSSHWAPRTCGPVEPFLADGSSHQSVFAVPAFHWQCFHIHHVYVVEVPQGTGFSYGPGFQFLLQQNNNVTLSFAA